MDKRYLYYFKWTSTLILSLCCVFAILWSLPNRYYHEIIPISFTRSGMPYGKVSIEGIPYLLKFDLGSRLDLALFEDILEPMKKTSKGTESFKNFRGTLFNRTCYVLPKVDIASLSFHHPRAISRPREDYKDYVVWRSLDLDISKHKPDLIVGSLGRGLLQKVNSLWDVQGSKIILSNDMKKLKNNNYDIKSFLKIPFTLTPKGIIIEVTTDLGKGKFILDSCATWSFIQSRLLPGSYNQKNYSKLAIYKSHQLSIGGINLGAIDLHSIEVTEELHAFHGFLGLDFFKNHVFYIDFDHKTLCIKN